MRKMNSPFARWATAWSFAPTWAEHDPLDVRDKYRGVSENVCLSLVKVESEERRMSDEHVRAQLVNLLSGAAGAYVV